MFRWKRDPKKDSRPIARRFGVFESLESRRLLTNMPFGAQPGDTGEFMLGTIVVTPVFFESNGVVDSSTENWNSAHIQQTLAKIDEALDWWVTSLQGLNTVHQLSFVVDTTFATQPVQTAYEPINRRSNDYELYANEFLQSQGLGSGNVLSDVRAFNHAQRQKFDTNWSFTMFVVNSQNQGDGLFAPGGSFNRAFAFAGGLFMVVPSTRPASTFAHETGHMFWARDEYVGGGSYYNYRGYYNSQNVNASDNPTPGFVQQPSIMAAGTLLSNAYQNFTSAPSTFAQIGWQDSDGDGIFDVLDVSSELTGNGNWDFAQGVYRFVGRAEVKTLPNQNSSGSGNDITLNKIRQIEYRIDSGSWQVIAQPNAYQVDLELEIPLTPGAQQVELRARDSTTTVTSNVFAAVRSPWQNPARLQDVNDDGRISAMDALLVINALNSSHPSDLSEAEPPSPPNPPYIDVNGDMRLTALDALWVINYLNSQSNFQAGGGGGPFGGEGEAFAAPPNEAFFFVRPSEPTIESPGIFASQPGSGTGLETSDLEIASVASSPRLIPQVSADLALEGALEESLADPQWLDLLAISHLNC
jgi:hypothetical protein